MTAGPIRPLWFVATKWDRTKAYTLRELIEWYKNVLATPEMPTGREVAYINSEWAALCSHFADQQGVPYGWVSYMVGELAKNEWDMGIKKVVGNE